MNRRSVVLSGGIASGKTFFSDYLAQLNANVIDTDVIARSLLTKGAPLYSPELIAQIRSDFGAHIFVNNLLDRRLLRQEIFNNANAKMQLENMMHPLILDSVKSFLANKNEKYHLIVVPLLAKCSRYLEFADEILIAEVDSGIQLNRVMHRDNVSEALALKIIQSQPTNQERRLLADTIIINTNQAHTQNILKQLDKKYSLASYLSVVK